MNFCNMSFQADLVCKCNIANFTLKWLLFFMHCINLLLHISCERCIANFKLKWLLSFMSWVNMLLQTPFINKSRTTQLWHLNVVSFVFWKNSRRAKRPFEINWPLSKLEFSTLKILSHLLSIFQFLPTL